MAKKTIVSVESDVSGKSPADTVAFGWDGYQYEIDLTDQEKEEFGKRFSDLIELSRVKGKRANGKPRPARSNLEASPSTVREWARSQGLDVPKRGRIPADIIDKFNSADKNVSVGFAIRESEVDIEDKNEKAEVDTPKASRASRKKTAAEKNEPKASKPVASEAHFSG